MNTIPRRQILRWCGYAAGMPILAPFLTQLVSDAHGQTNSNRRYVQFTSGNGIWKDEYKPYFNGAQKARLADRALPSIFEPFERLKNKMTIMGDFYCPFIPELHGSGGGVFEMRKPPARRGRKYMHGGQTFDRFAGQHLSTNAPIQSLNFVCSTHRGYFGIANVSSDGYDKPFAPDFRPIEAFDRMFGQPLNPGGPSVRILLEQQKSVLDFVSQDIAGLQKRLAQPERLKMEQFTESIRGLEQQLDRIVQESSSCDSPIAPNSNLDGALQVDAADDPASGAPGTHVDRRVADAFIELAAVALACNLTHSAFITFDTLGAETVYGFLGDEVRHVHTHSHKLRGGGQPINTIPKNNDTERATTMLYAMWHYFGSQITKLYDRLDSIAEGGGSMADNSLMLWGATSGGRHHSGNNEHPLILLGDAGGAVNSGNFFDFGNGSAGRNDLGDFGTQAPRSLCDPFTTVAHALGINVDSFGDPKLFTGVLPGVLT